MRFSLSIISATMLATVAMAAPAALQENSNSEIDTEFVPAQKVALEMSEQFQPFNWMAVDNANSVDRTFTLNLAEPAQLQVTDYKRGGDSFEILDNGKLLGSTSDATNEEGAFAATPEEALQDERFSHAAFDLAAGEHTININVANSPFSDGTGAVRLVQRIQALYDKKGGKGKKGGWGDDDDDDEWDDDEDDWDEDDDDWEDDKKGRWDDDKKGDWDDDKKGDWDDKKGGWDDKKGGWDDDEWDHGKDGWGKKNTVYVYYTVPETSSSVPPTDIDTTIDVTATETILSTELSFTPVFVATDVETSYVTEVEVETDLAFLSLPFITL